MTTNKQFTDKKSEHGRMQLYVTINLFNESGKQHKEKKNKIAIRHFEEKNVPHVSNQKKKKGFNSKNKAHHLST